MISAGTILKRRYKVVRLLKTGGMGFVHEGEYKGKKCIIKEPKPGEGIKENNYFLEKIKIEAEVLKKIKHNFIVGYIDSFEERNSFFLIEEYVEGEKFGDKYYNNPGSEDEVIDHTLQLLNAVQYLHNKQIKHRDINPNNIILSTTFKKIVLIDFGTAKYFRIARKKTQGVPRSTIVGTSYYTPPEQWDGESSEVSDIFSIGRTMYFMLTGEHPPDSPYKRLDFQGKIIDKKLADIVIKAAEPEIKDRYSTVVEVIRYLEAVKKGKSNEITKETKARLIVGANTFTLGSFMTIGSELFGIANILIPDPDPKGPYIEKIHAVIKKENEKYWLYDNYSRFGTFVEEPGRKILLTSRKDVIQYLKDRGYIPLQKTSEKKLLKDGDFISLAWDPILGDYINLQFRE